MGQVLDWTKVDGSSRAFQAVSTPEHFIQIRRRRRDARCLDGRQGFPDPLNVLFVLDLKRGKEPLTEILHVRYLSTLLLICCPSIVRFVAAFSS